MDKSLYSSEYSAFLQHLRDSRRHNGLTQAEVGSRLGTTQSFVSKCERGERRIDVVETRAFCNAIEIDFVDFISILHKRLSAASSQGHPR